MWAQAGTVTVSRGVPLRVEVDRGYRLKVGTRIAGRLIEPVYVGDGLAIPQNTRITGRITGAEPLARGERADALMNGDFTPLKRAVIEFDTLQLANGDTLHIATSVTERTTEVVRFEAGQQRHSLVGMAKEQIAQKKDALEKQLKPPNKMDRLRRFLYGQLPYHPQEVWAGSQFDAELMRPLAVPAADAGRSWPAADGADHKLVGAIHARLTSDLNSAVTKRGADVHAVLTQPLMDAENKHVILPEGTDLSGVVLQSKPARSFGRNGALRFTFRKVAVPQQAPKTVYGQVVGAEGADAANLSIDSEGGVKANPSQGRFLAPLVLGMLAAHSTDSDGNQTATGAVSSNGFGLAARVIAMTAVSPELTLGIGTYGFAQSVYKRWIARGHEVKFPKDTELEIALSER